MHGAMLGDIWGSIFETIPKFPRRLFMCPTDDSFLTAACLEFLENLSVDEYEDPFTHEQIIYEKAVKALKEWGNLFPEPGAYSTGFLNWCKEEGTKYKVASTNGCIMRNSPIALKGFSMKLEIEKIQKIAHIFCSTTHKSEESFQSVIIHTEVLHKALSGLLLKEHLSFEYQDYVHPIEHWLELAKNVKNNYIWKSSDSLGIALSAISQSENWEDMMRYFITISGDVDTYAAIAGPLAQIYFPEMDNLTLKRLEDVFDIEESDRMQRLKTIYFYLKKKFYKLEK